MSKREKEPWKTDPKRLREVFDDVLERIWEEWDQLGVAGVPFKDSENIFELDLPGTNIAKLFFDIGWARGVSEAEGWPLSRPGSKEWSPSDFH